MSRLQVMMLMLFSALLCASAIVLLRPANPSGRGVLVDAQGKRHEIVSSRPPRAFAREILSRFRQWRDPNGYGLSPQERLRRAYALLLGVAAAGVLAIVLVKRARPS